MAKRNNHNSKKPMKEINRKEKAKEKPDRQQGKNNEDLNDAHEGQNNDRPALIADMLKQLKTQR